MALNYSKDGFLFYKEKKSEDSILGDRLIVESSKLGHTIDYINSENIQSLSIESDYFRLDNLIS